MRTTLVQGIRTAIAAKRSTVVGLSALALVAGLAGSGLLLGSDGAQLPRANAASPGLTQVADASTAKFSPAQKSQIEAIIRDYLVKNPEIMLEVQAALQAKSEKLEAKRLKAAVKANHSELFARPNASIAGNPKGDVTVVEFFDYNCGFCKRALGDIAKLVKTDKNIRVVFKELPILSKGSEEAARVALAARNQGKYWEMHKALLGARGRASTASALKLAAKLGLDMKKLKADMKSAAVTKEIEDTRNLAQKMGINGTPHFLVGDKVIPGAPENLLEEIETHAALLRKK